MPRYYGMVDGRNHGVIRDAKEPPAIRRACRDLMKFDTWEAELVERWKRQGVGDITIALRTMRPLSQIARFDPVRPNGRRS